eukprot:9835279-Alexandrium_andersonii.AAC.1
MVARVPTCPIPNSPIATTGRAIRGFQMYHHEREHEHGAAHVLACCGDILLSVGALGGKRHPWNCL